MSRPLGSVPLSVGDHCKLGGPQGRWWWRVQAVTEHFVACVHQAEFKPKGTLCYTVLDWRNGIRGPCNLIGQGYGDGSYSEEECARMLAEFEHSEVFEAKLMALPPGTSLPTESTLEISHRNNVPLAVIEIRRAT